MIDWINRISFTGFHDWLVSAVHPLIMVTAVCALTGAAAYYLVRSVGKASVENRGGWYLVVCLGFPFWLISWCNTTYACFKVHGVNDGEPIIAVMAVCVILYCGFFFYWVNRAFGEIDD